MSIIESLVHGGLSLANMYYQTKATFSGKEGAVDAENAATKVYLAKTIEEFIHARDDW